MSCLSEKGAQQEGCPESLPSACVTAPHGSSLWLGAELRLEHSLPSGLSPLSPSIQHHCWDPFCSFLCGLALSPLEGCSLSQGSGNPLCVLGAISPHSSCWPWRALAGWRLVHFWDVLASSQHVLWFSFFCSVLNPYYTDVGSHQ